MKQPPAKLKLKMMKEARKNLQNMQAKDIGVGCMLADVERKISYYGKLARYEKKNKKKMQNRP